MADECLVAPVRHVPCPRCGRPDLTIDTVFIHLRFCMSRLTDDPKEEEEEKPYVVPNRDGS